MATRVTGDEVKLLMQGLADNVDPTLFIDQANMVVEEELVAKNSGLSASRLRFIELNLAAHYAVISVERGTLTYQKANTSEEGYLGRNSTGSMQSKFSATRFGQQALALDTTGNLSALDTPGGKAEFRVM